MSATIDSKIVEMKFDNKDFEQNVATSMTSLQKLEQALNFGAKNNKGLDSLQNAAKNIDFSSIAAAVDTINDRFSTMGIIGMTVISRLTNAAIDMGKRVITAIPSQIAHGGWQRALNVEQAKFTLEGLGIAWEEVSEDIDHAVMDTAYGADEASKAASVLAAAGVNFRNATKDAEGNTLVYSDMGRSLRAISGVAAMTNSTYAEMADVFEAVAGKGKLQRMELSRIEAKGLGVTSELAKQMGKSTAEINDMISKGKISFQMFADAMDSAFGEHATKANDTMQGSMANMKSALSRIGQDFAQTIQTQTPQVFNSLKGFFNQIRKYTKPFADNIFTPMFTKNMETISKIIDHFTDSMPKLEEGTLTLDAYNVLIKALGRILEGVQNIFYSFLIALLPIGDAFKEIFGDILGSQSILNLSKFAVKFKDFTEQLVISEETADKIKRTFKGVFAVFDILGQAVEAIVKAVLPAGSAIADFADGFLDITANIGDSIVALDEWIRSTKLFENFAEKIVGIVTPIFAKIKNVFLGIFDIFKNISGINFGGLTAISNKLDSAFGPMEEKTKKIGSALETIKSLFSSVGVAIKNVVSSVARSVGSTLSSLFSGATFQTLIQILNGVAVSGFAISLDKFIQLLHNTFKEVKRPLTNLNNIMIQFKNTLVMVQSDLKADVLKRIAVAVGVLAASIWLISTIDPERLTSSLAAIGGLMTELMASFAAFQKLSSLKLNATGFFGFFKNIGNMFKGFIDAGMMILTAKAMISFAIAIGILAVSVKLLSSIKTEDLEKGVIAVGALMAELSGVMVLFSKFGASMRLSAVALLAVGVSVLFLASAVKKIAEIDTNKLGTAVLAIGALMLSLAAFMILVGRFSSTKLGLGDALAIIAVAAAMEILADVVKKFGEMDLDQLKQGLAATAIGLIALAAAIAIMGTAGAAGLAGSVGALVLAAALEIVADVVNKFANMEIANLAKGLIAFGIALGVMVGAMALLGLIGPLAIVGAAGVLVLSVALGVLTVSIVALSKIKFSSLIKSIFSMAAALVVLGGIGAILGVISPLLLLASLGIMAFAKSLLILVPAIFAFSQIGVTNVLKALGGLLLLSAALVPISIILALLSPLLLAASAGMIAFGIGVTLVGTGLSTFALGLMSIATSLPIIASSIKEVLPMFGDIFLGLLDIAIQALPKVFELLGRIFLGVIEIVVTYSGPIADALATMLVDILDAIGSHIEEFIDAGAKLLIGFLAGMQENIPKVVQAAIDLIVSLGEGLAKGIKENTPKVLGAMNALWEAIFFALGSWLANIPEVGKAVVTGLAEGLGLDGEAIAAGAKLIEDTIESIKKGITNVWKLGKDLVDGFVNGIIDFAGGVWDAGKALADKALGGIAKGQESNSPSKKGHEKGLDLTAGYTNGIEEGSDEAVSAAETMAKEAVDSLDSASVKAEQIGIKQAEQAERHNAAIVEGLSSRAQKEEHIHKERQDTQARIERNITEDLKAEAGRREQILLKQSQYAKTTYRDMSIEAQRMAIAGTVATGTGSKVADIFLKKLGITDTEMKKLGGTLDGTTKEADKASKGMDGLASSTEKAGKKAKDAKNEFEKFKESIESKLESKTGGMSFFSKLELKTETTAASILENMKSNVDGVASWTARLAQVAEKGLDQGLIKVLAEAGLESYDQVSAFLQMSDEQIAQANELFKQQAAGRAYAVNTIGDSFLKSGQGAVDGLVNGLMEGKDRAKTEAAALGQATVDGLNGPEGLDEHSPSKKTYESGKNVDLGLMTGISGYASRVTSVVAALCRQIKYYFEDGLRYDWFRELGMNVGQGLLDGLNESGEKAIGRAEEIATQVGEIMAKALQVESPSKLTRWIGSMVGLGLSKGMDDSSKWVENSAENLATTTTTSLQKVVEDASKYVTNNMDLNPTITPMLDLSPLMDQVSSIDSLFADKEMAVASGSRRTGTGSTFTSDNGAVVDGNGNTNYIFNQNNYSPKALSRLDIYRDSRNLFSSMKGAVQGT